MFNQPRLLSRPVGVEWAGWRTDTFTLQQNGWEIATEYEIRHDAYRLLLRHKMMRLYAVSTSEHVEHFMSVTSPSYDPSRLPVFRICGVAPSIQSLQMPGIDFSAFRQIDAQPQFTTHAVQRVEDMNIFATPLTRTQEILIDKADMTVIEHLEAIKKLQSPEQQVIRERMVREGPTREGEEIRPSPRMHMVAQLIHIERAA